MADANGNLQTTDIWTTGVYELKTTDSGLGGPPVRDGVNAVSGDLNIPLQELTQRTGYLRQRMDGIELTASDDLDDITTPSTYRWAGSTPQNAPGGLTTQAVMSVSVVGGQPIQMAWGGTAGRMALRQRVGGVWVAWTFVWTGADAIFERGSTGRRITPDGFFEQWFTAASSPSGNWNLTFPWSFPSVCLGLNFHHIGGDVMSLLEVQGTRTQGGVQLSGRDLNNVFAGGRLIFVRAFGF